MCDYSLQSIKSRPARVGDKLTTRDFGTGTRGFAASEDASVAVCVLPGTELSFAEEVRCLPIGLIAWRDKMIGHKTAIFRQVNNDKVAAHHDALEFPDGQIVLRQGYVRASRPRFCNCRRNQRLPVKLNTSGASLISPDCSQQILTQWPPIDGGHFGTSLACQWDTRHCPCRKLNPDVLVVQSAQDWHRQYATE